MTLLEHFKPFFANNVVAAQFIEDVFNAWNIWDDLIDKDKPVSDDQINKAFILAFINIPRNSFYQAHFNMLNPIVENTIHNWIASVQLEKDKNQLDISFDLRNSYVNLVTACANIIGGQAWASQVAIAAHRALREIETYTDYVTDIQKQTGSAS